MSPVIGSDPVLPSVNLCKDQSATFSVTDTPGSTYSWSLPAGAFITGDATKHSVLVTFPLAPITAGIVSVYETNGACSSFHPGAVVNVYTLPMPTIAGNSIACVTSTGNIYSTPVSLIEEGDKRWLVAPYGQVNWVKKCPALRFYNIMSWSKM